MVCPQLMILSVFIVDDSESSEWCDARARRPPARLTVCTLSVNSGDVLGRNKRSSSWCGGESSAI
jgi:hypothetical protein